MLGKPSIQKIIRGCCKKQPRYQRLLVEKYSGFLYAICLRYMKNESKAKDQLQNSLFKVLDKIQTYNQERGAIESWMSTIAINNCLSELRKKTPNIVPISEVHGKSMQVDPTILDDFNTSGILSIVQSLPDVYREIFNLSVIDGYNHQEIAELLGIEVSSSRSRLSRAKQMLREKLQTIKKNESWVSLA